MKKILFVTTLVVSGIGSAHAAPPSTFNATNYFTCAAHSLNDVEIAKKADREGQSAETFLNEYYHQPRAIDVKLTRLASDAIGMGFLKTAGAEERLRGFLTGVCFESGIDIEPSALKNAP
ncbi:hypothetical protein [Burkholderia sp. Ac-20365]|uniref:hypothetical protein n=1 Tax=Burkholderia sp. Ac-20365 TaxID=2703897 RepID=UPI00197C472B|nr:hypothetical protein [Burkholderia sp. Ac-20365]MBN3761185.1 hypothetical protein [Burkholderia sp. Ac-20365]